MIVYDLNKRLAVTAAALDAAGIPHQGVSVGEDQDPAGMFVHFLPVATAQQRVQAQQIIDAKAVPTLADLLSIEEKYRLKANKTAWDKVAKADQDIIIADLDADADKLAKADKPSVIVSPVIFRIVDRETRKEKAVAVNPADNPMEFDHLCRAMQTGQDLSGQDLSGRFLRESIYDGSKFDGANLRFADLKPRVVPDNLGKRIQFGGSFKGCSFKGADLTGACLDYCDCTGADFTNAKVDGMTCQYAKIVLTSEQLKAIGYSSDRDSFANVKEKVVLF